jgi:muconate cycloisomerase
MDIYQTAIPMRGFKHAAAERNVAESVVAAVQFDDGSVGWGETLPREYVTGETFESVIADLAEVIWPRWAGRDMAWDDEVAEIAPHTVEGRCINAAICAFDIACLRRIFRSNDEPPSDALKALTGRAQIRRQIDVPVSGVLGTSNRRKTRRQLRALRWFGLEHFKLKFTADERANAQALQVVRRQLGRAMDKGRSTLRVDVNSAWTMVEAIEQITALVAWGVCAVEQPVECSAQQFVELARKSPLPLIADESLLTDADADILLAEPQRVWWNIRLSKNGGVTGALRLSRLAAKHGVTAIVGCMVGESSILSAAQRRALQLGAGCRFVEGNFGRLLMRDDLTTRGLRFGYGGRLKVLPAEGLGVMVDPGKLAQYGRLVRAVQA